MYGQNLAAPYYARHILVICTSYISNRRGAYGQNAPRIFCVGPRVGRCTNMRGAYGYMRLLYLTICEAHMTRMRLTYSVWARVLVGARICEAHMAICASYIGQYARRIWPYAPQVTHAGPGAGRWPHMRGAYCYMRLL